MVNVGLTAPIDGKKLASVTYRLSRLWTLQLRSRTEVAGSGLTRRRLAFECLDATEHAPHLAGALGDALATALFARGWIEHGAGREIAPTAAGTEGLCAALGSRDGWHLRR